MPCLSPLDGYRPKDPLKQGKRLVFKLRDGYFDRPVKVPCGQCSGCRLERSRNWAIRATHEASLYGTCNSFLTLTYAPEHLPRGGSIEPQHAVDFMKRLRDRISPRLVRSFGCAEYGEKLSRPHYHICIFNFDFPDKKLWKTVRGYGLYNSELLQSLWPLGHSAIGEFTFESAAYVARYVMKKQTGKGGEDHYFTIDEYGDRTEILPEQTVCLSRMPGLGKPWLEKFQTDVYPCDNVVLRGKKFRPPRYYDSIYDQVDPESFAKLKLSRKLASKQCLCLRESCDCDPEGSSPRLYARAQVLNEKTNRLKRKMEP